MKTILSFGKSYIQYIVDLLPLKSLWLNYIAGLGLQTQWLHCTMDSTKTVKENNRNSTVRSHF